MVRYTNVQAGLIRVGTCFGGITQRNRLDASGRSPCATTGTMSSRGGSTGSCVSSVLSPSISGSLPLGDVGVEAACFLNIDCRRTPHRLRGRHGTQVSFIVARSVGKAVNVNKNNMMVSHSDAAACELRGLTVCARHGALRHLRHRCAVTSI